MENNIALLYKLTMLAEQGTAAAECIIKDGKFHIWNPYTQITAPCPFTVDMESPVLAKELLKRLIAFRTEPGDMRTSLKDDTLHIRCGKGSTKMPLRTIFMFPERWLDCSGWEEKATLQHNAISYLKDTLQFIAKDNLDVLERYKAVWKAGPDVIATDGARALLIPKGFGKSKTRCIIPRRFISFLQVLFSGAGDEELATGTAEICFDKASEESEYIGCIYEDITITSSVIQTDFPAYFPDFPNDGYVLEFDKEHLIELCSAIGAVKALQFIRMVVRAKGKSYIELLDEGVAQTTLNLFCKWPNPNKTDDSLDIVFQYSWLKYISGLSPEGTVQLYIRELQDKNNGVGYMLAYKADMFVSYMMSKR